MTILFINGCFREGSRTLKLAEKYLKKANGEIKTIKLGDMSLPMLDSINTVKYCNAVAVKDYSDTIFSFGKEFAEADEIVIAAPFWNFSIPAKLHAYLELVCSQGATFTINEKGEYISLCKAKKLVYITTAGGIIPAQDHAWCYIQDLCKYFWNINELEYYKAEGLDIYGADVEAILKSVM